MKALTSTLWGQAALIALFTLTVLSPQTARAQMAQPSCADRGSVLKQLSAQYKEAPVNMGLTNSGAVLEVMASDDGTWTIVLTMPTGVTCMMAAGKHWEAVKPKKAGYTPSNFEATH